MHNPANCGPVVARSRTERSAVFKKRLNVTPLSWGFELERAKGIEPS